jgi:hypothetical protein
MKLINLTDRSVTIKTSSGKELIIPPSGKKIRLPEFVIEKTTTYPNFFRVEKDRDKFLIEKKLARLFFQLPPRQKLTIYIVDVNTLALISLFCNRPDFMFASEAGELCVLQRKKTSNLKTNNSKSYE